MSSFTTRTAGLIVNKQYTPGSALMGAVGRCRTPSLKVEVGGGGRRCKSLGVNTSAGIEYTFVEDVFAAL